MDAVTETRQLGIKAIERIEAMPRSEKWRATRELVLAANPKLEPVDRKFQELVKRERDTLMSATGAGQHGRRLLSMPDFIYAALIALDPQLKPELDSKDRPVRDRAWNSLTKAFPEYSLVRKI